MIKLKSRKTVIAGFMLALGILLPFITSHGLLPLSGKIFLPMHIPVLLCSFLCGSFYGGICGFFLPYLNSVITGMPIMFPNAVIMSFELMTYGIMCSFMFNLFGARRKLRYIYPSLIISMISGRIIYGFAASILMFFNTGLSGISVVAATISGIPGIIIQLLLVPQIVRVLIPSDKAKEQAVSRIRSNDATCVVVKDNKIITSFSDKGISGIIRLCEQGVLSDTYVADTIIGKGAAIVFVEGGVRECYGRTVSQPALSYLLEKNIPVSYDEVVDVIINRSGDGMCPMEAEVINVDSSKEGIRLLKEKLKKLKAENKHI